MALAQAQDLSDKTAFDSKAAQNPRMQKYAERVEQELQKMRTNGQSAPRQAIYLFLLGQDIDAGNFKPAKSAKSGALPASARGRTTGAKSDVDRKGAKSEAQKREARLLNVQI